MAGLLTATYQLTSSVVQPALGALADRFGTRVFSFAGTSMAAIGAASLGVAPGYVALLIMVALQGLGTASFHPQSAAMVSSLVSGRRGTVMSVYITAGNAGYALGPMIVVGVVTLWGLQATPLLAIPGLLSAILLALYAPRDWLRPPDRERLPLWQAISRKRLELSRLLVIATFRSVAMFSWMTFLPLLFQSRGYPPTVWAGLMTFLLLAGAVGGLLGGSFSDVVGRRLVIVWSLVLAVPLLFLTLRAEGIGLWIVVALAGAAMMASFSTLTIKAQEMLPGNVGMASGLILGFGMGVGGLGTWPAAFLAERLGIFDTLSMLAFLPLLAAMVAWNLPKEARGRGRDERAKAQAG